MSWLTGVLDRWWERREPPPPTYGAWEGIEPGDIGYDRGGGLVGWAIGAFCRTAQSHSYLYVQRQPDGAWWTHEARGGGPLKLCRRVKPPNKVHRVWHTEPERKALLAKSSELVGTGYDYRELIRICLTMLGLPILKAKDNKGKVICANHVAQCVLAARPDIPLSYAPEAIWPGKLAEDLDQLEFAERVVGGPAASGQ
jgi:hypothetical protein